MRLRRPSRIQSAGRRPWRFATVTTLCVLILLAQSVAPLLAQEGNDIEDLLDSYLGPNASGYLKPAAEILGASLNSGFTRTANIRPGVHVRLSLEAGVASVGDDQRFFRGTTDGNFQPQQTTDAPTIVGPREAVVVQGAEGTAYVFPAGLGVGRMGLVVPQLSIGSVMGTDATVRFFAYDIEDFGEISLLGLGVRHSISQYMDLPVDLAVGGFYNKLKLTEAVLVTSVLANLQASKTMSLLTLYGGLGFETSTMDVDFPSEQAETGRVQIDVDGAKGIRATAGGAINLPGVMLHADLNVGTQTVITIGLGLGN